MALGGDYSEPATSIVAVTKSDSTDLTGARGIYVGGAGDVAVKTVNGDSATTAVTISTVAAGTILPIRITRVMSTNTTATAILAFY